MSRVVVIGAGIGGLAVAARLARLRHDVSLVERSDTIGGKAGIYTRDGFTFDTGPSLITLPATLRDLFLKTGKPLEDSLELLPLDPLAHYRFPDGTEMDLPNSGVADIAQAFQDVLGGSAGRDWQRFHDRAERTWAITRSPFVESALEGPGALVSLALRRPADLQRIAPWRTLRDLGRTSFADPRQRLFLDRYATYTGSDPRRAPSVLAVIPYVEQTFRGWYVAGGMRRVVDAVSERAEQRGVRVRTGCPVARISTSGSASGGRADGVVLADGSRIDADIVVSDVDANVLYDDLLPHTGAARSLRRATRSSSAFVLLLALRGRTPGLRQHTVLFGDDYDAEMDATFGPDAAPAQAPTIYISAPADAAPEGHEAWFVLVNAARHGNGAGSVDWDAPGVAASYADHILDQLAARGFDVRPRLLFMQRRTPADLGRDTGTPDGAIYGTSSNGWRAAFLRARNRSPVPGVFLVGGSAHPGGGVPMVLMSAAITAEMIGRA